MVRLIGALSNPENRGRLARLAALRKHLLQQAAQAPAQAATAPPRHDEVQRAIVQILEGAAAPMSIREVRTAAKQQLSRPVAKSTVGNCLATQSKSAKPLFKKVDKGRYSLVNVR